MWPNVADATSASLPLCVEKPEGETIPVSIKETVTPVVPDSKEATKVTLSTSAESVATEFLCCDNGDHSTDELFTRDVTAKNAKDGFILAVFRTGHTGGEAKITVRAEGLEPVTQTVTVQ